jgi:hypothetical protein
MKNIPKKIYLQIGEYYIDCIGEDFNKLEGVTWCANRINKNDIVYYRKVKEK